MLLVEIKDLQFRTPDGRIQFGPASLNLHSGEALLITGPNGSGKSTFLKALLGHWPTRGKIQFHLPQAKIAFLPQLENTECHFPVTLKDILEFSAPTEKWQERVDQIGLITSQQLPLQWNTASGGERKRTLMTRTLLNEPSLLLLDEPLNHLDSASRLAVEKTLRDYLAEGATKPRALILVAHEGFQENEISDWKFLRLHLGSELEGAP